MYPTEFHGLHHMDWNPAAQYDYAEQGRNSQDGFFDFKLHLTAATKKTALLGPLSRPIFHHLFNSELYNANM